MLLMLLFALSRVFLDKTVVDLDGQVFTFTYVQAQLSHTVHGRGTTEKRRRLNLKAVQ
jgi:hypothetical protein